MIVFDVIHVVTHDAARLSSYEPGRHWETSRDSREDAEQLADLYNRKRHLTDGHHYEVEERSE